MKIKWYGEPNMKRIKKAAEEYLKKGGINGTISTPKERIRSDKKL